MSGEFRRFFLSDDPEGQGSWNGKADSLLPSEKEVAGVLSPNQQGRRSIHGKRVAKR